MECRRLPIFCTTNPFDDNHASAIAVIAVIVVIATLEKSGCGRGKFRMNRGLARPPGRAHVELACSLPWLVN